jgi:hypothetical protein
MYVTNPGKDEDAQNISLFSNRFAYAGFLSASGKGHAGKKKTPRFQTIFKFYNYIVNILPIRQIDHAFIPLFFHWSGRYIKRQLLKDGFISNF